MRDVRCEKRGWANFRRGLGSRSTAAGLGTGTNIDRETRPMWEANLIPLSNIHAVGATNESDRDYPSINQTGVKMASFNPSSSHPDRALQAWLVLVGAAMNRQTLTYEGLSVLMYGRKAQGVLDRILGHVAFYCIENDLPPLTAIVVGKKRGTPGTDIPIDLSRRDLERERVYAHDWYDVYPPSSKQLKAAFTAHMK